MTSSSSSTADSTSFSRYSSTWSLMLSGMSSDSLKVAPSSCSPHAFQSRFCLPTVIHLASDPELEAWCKPCKGPFRRCCFSRGSNLARADAHSLLQTHWQDMQVAGATEQGL